MKNIVEIESDCYRAYINWLIDREDPRDQKFNIFYEELKSVISTCIRKKYIGINPDKVEDVVSECMIILYRQEFRKKEKFHQRQDINIIDNWIAYCSVIASRNGSRYVANTNSQVFSLMPDDTYDILFNYTDEELEEWYELGHFYYPKQEEILLFKEIMFYHIPKMINNYFSDFNNFEDPYRGILNYIAFCSGLNNVDDDIIRKGPLIRRLKNLSIKVEEIIQKQFYGNQEIL